MRTIEVFTAGCPLCNDTLKLVQDAVKECGCEVIERRCTGEECSSEAKNTVSRPSRQSLWTG